MIRRRLRGPLLLLLGALMGLLVVVLAAYFWVERARRAELAAVVRQELGLPEEAFELEAVEDDGTLRVALRNVALLDRAGDTVLTAPRMRMVFDARSLSRDGPILFTSAEIERPFLRLVPDADGTWNFTRIFRVEAEGQEVGGAPGADGEEARPILVRNVAIRDGRALIYTPYTAPATDGAVRFAADRQPETVRVGGRVLQVHAIRNLDARLAAVRFGGEEGWRVEVAQLSADVLNPDLRITRFAGTFEATDAEGDEIRFDVDDFQTGNSRLAARGRLILADDGVRYDLTVNARRLDFADLQGTALRIPREGVASFNVEVETLEGGRTRLAFTDAEVETLGSSAGGQATVVLDPEGGLAISGARIDVAALRLSTLEEAGLIDQTPFLGTVRGTITSVDEVRDGAGTLRLDLSASVTPRDDPGSEPSTLALTGDVTLTGDEAAPVRLAGLRVETQGLQLATLRPLFPESADLLRGTLTGDAVLSGTPNDLRIDGGTLAYQVGDAPTTRISGVQARVQRGETLRWNLSGRAEPLALGTLRELFPALPVQDVRLTGPIAASGNGDDITYRADLTGAAGGIALNGTARLGEVPSFDFSARLEAFRPGGLLATQTPVDGPLTGTVSARGTVEDFRFDANLRQGTGSFALGGSIRRPGGSSPQFDVAGRVDDFRIGALLGRPDLLPGTVTGPIAVSGGGRQPLRFDVNLRGPQGVFNVEGSYAAGDVPRYVVRGEVAGLDVSAFPGLDAVPATRLSGTLAVDARGTTPETFAGTVFFDAVPGSTIGGVPLEVGRVRVAAEGGVLRVDTLVLGLRGARAEASGRIGLTREVGGGLAFNVSAPDLARVQGLFPRLGAEIPPVAGAIAGSGVVTGSLSDPSVRAALNGRGIRYGEYAAETVQLAVDLARAGTGWIGTVSGTGTRLVLPGGQTLQSATLAANLTPERATFNVAATRDDQTDLAAAGTLELVDGMVRGAILDTLNLRLGGTTWTLGERARIAWSPDTGLEVENLALRRSGIAGAGWLQVEGSLPPTGIADLVVRIGGVDLAEIRPFVPQLPDVRGTVWLDASVVGPVRDPRVELTGRVLGFRYGAVETDSIALAGLYEDGRMALDAGLFIDGRSVVVAEGSVPMTLSLGGFVPGVELLDEGALTARIVADSLPLALITELTPGLSEGAGVARADVRVSGTVDRPRVAGQIMLDGGALRSEQLGVRWRDIGARISLDGSLIRVDSLTARAGDGAARVSGTIQLDQPGEPQVYLVLALQEFQVIDRRRVASLEATGRLALSGRFPDATLSGRIQVEDGTIYVPDFTDAEVDIIDAEVGELGADTAFAPAAGGGAAALLAGLNAQDLTVVIGERVMIESAEARVQIGGELALERAAGATRVYGELQALRGTYRFQAGPFVREFDIVSGSVRFFGTPDLNPAIDIRAANEVRTVDASGRALTIFVDVTGTLASPRVQLSSDTRPPLPESELLSILITGRRATGVGQFFDPAVAQGLLVQELVGGLVFGEIEEELARTGLVDYVRVRSRYGAGGSGTGAGDGAFGGEFQTVFGSPTLELGKEIVDDLFLTLEVQDFLTEPRLGIAGDFQVSRTSRLRLAWEPVRRDPLFQSFISDQSRRQITAEWRRRWEYARPPVTGELPRPATRDTLPGVVAPMPPGAVLPPADTVRRDTVVVPPPAPVPDPPAPTPVPPTPQAPSGAATGRVDPLEGTRRRRW